MLPRNGWAPDPHRRHSVGDERARSIGSILDRVRLGRTPWISVDTLSTRARAGPVVAISVDRGWPTSFVGPTGATSPPLDLLEGPPRLLGDALAAFEALVRPPAECVGIGGHDGSVALVGVRVPARKPSPEVAGSQ